MDREARIDERIHAVAKSRVGREIVTPKGDLITEEIEETDEEGQP